MVFLFWYWLNVTYYGKSQSIAKHSFVDLLHFLRITHQSMTCGSHFPLLPICGVLREHFITSVMIYFCPVWKVSKVFVFPLVISLKRIVVSGFPFLILNNVTYHEKLQSTAKPSFDLLLRFFRIVHQSMICGKYYFPAYDSLWCFERTFHHVPYLFQSAKTFKKVLYVVHRT